MRRRTFNASTPLEASLHDIRGVARPLIVFSILLNLLLLVSPIYMMQVFDRVLTSGRGETLIFLTLIAMVAMGVLGILEWARMGMLSRIGIWLEKRLAPDIARRQAPGGIVVLSGLLTRQAPGVLAVYRACGYRPVGSVKIDGWSTLVLRLAR